MANEKRCTKCGEVKPLTSFGVHRQGASGPLYRSRCKPCSSADATGYYWRKGREASIARSRARRYGKYGITAEQYAAMLETQNGVCAVCDQPEKAVMQGVLMKLAIDHDHDDGHVRGLLCARCNRALGLLGDSPELVKRLLAYLEEDGLGS